MKRRFKLGSSASRRTTFAFGAVVLAFAAIVISRAASATPEGISSPPPSRVGSGRVAARLPIDGDGLRGFVALTQSAVLENGVREVFGEARIEASAASGEAPARRDVAMTIVLDTSGSMMGNKIADARRSVSAVVARMHPTDRVAIVAYNHAARVVLPMMSVAEARSILEGRVHTLQAGGGTDIPAGLTLGASLLANAPASLSRRMVLISDGLDGSGQPLVTVQRAIVARANGGTTTSALGVGVDYDERWLTTVADAGRGNYEFLAFGEQLAGFLSRELDQASTTVAEGAVLAFGLPAGWRLADVYGATRHGDEIPLGSLWSGQRRRVTVRFEIDAPAAGRELSASAVVRYRAVRQNVDRSAELGRLALQVVDDDAQVDDSRDVTLHAEAVSQYLDARQALAMDAWRDGDIERARTISQDNIAQLNRWREQAPAARGTLDGQIQESQADLDNFEQNSAGSLEGRSWGLGSNARRRSRQASF